MLIAVSAALLALGLLAYRRQLLVRSSFGLLALRLAVLALLALVLAGSTLRLKWTEKPRHVAVLADRSLSVTALGLDSIVNRVAVRFPVPAGLERRMWAFADTVLRFEDLPDAGRLAESRAGRTRVALALEAAARTRPAAIVLVSDGQDNGGTDSRVAAARGNVAVYAVGVGPDAARNLALTALVLPSVVKAGETATATVRLKSAGLAGERARVRLLGQVRDVVLDAGPAEAEVSFRVVFARPGPARLSAVAESLSGEVSYADNEKTALVEVGAGTLLVAYIGGQLGAQTRFVTRAFAADSALTLRLVEPGAGAVPAWLDSADLLVLDCPVENPRSEPVYRAAAARIEAGAGALVLAGPGMVTGAATGRVLGAALLPAPWKGEPVEPLPAGRLMPWFGPDGVKLDSVPPFEGFRVLTADPPASDAWVKTASGKSAILFCRHGRGRVVYVAGYPLWRWGFAASVRPGSVSPLEAFLRGVSSFLADADTVRFRLAPVKPTFLDGEAVRLALLARSPDGRAWTGLDAEVDVTAESAGESVRAPMAETGDGRYEVDVAGLKPGEYEARARVGVAGDSLGFARAGFAVEPRPLELAQVGRDRQLLEDIARVSGGAYFDAESLPGMAYELRTATFERGFSIDPRRSVWLLVAAALLAGLEWVLRRREGML